MLHDKIYNSELRTGSNLWYCADMTPIEISKARQEERRARINTFRAQEFRIAETQMVQALVSLYLEGCGFRKEWVYPFMR